MKNVAKLNLLLILVLVTAGCSPLSKQNLKINEGTDSLLPLKIFGEVSISAEVLNKTIRENNIAINAKIKEIKSIKVEFSEILLEEGEIVTIEFTGIGNEANWTINNAAIGNVIQVDLRCLDGRINSLESFTKDDCYWEGADETVIIK